MKWTPGELRTVVTEQGLVSYRYAAPSEPTVRTPVVLLHGLGGSSIVWSRNLDALAEDRTVFAPDLWGDRHSERREGFSPQTGIRFLGSFMDTMGIDQAHLVGSSLGGLIAGHFGLAHPSRARSLTLVDSAGLGREIGWAQRLLTLPGVGEFFFRPTKRRVHAMLKLLIRRGDIPEELFQSLYEDSLEPGVTKQMLTALRAGVTLRGVKPSVQLLACLRELAIPMSLLWGEKDPLFPVAHAHHAAATIPRARLHVFAGGGHWPHFEDPAVFNQLLIAFFNSVETDTAA